MMKLIVVISVTLILFGQTVVGSVNSAYNIDSTVSFSNDPTQTSIATYELKYMWPIVLSKMNSGNEDNTFVEFVKLY